MFKTIISHSSPDLMLKLYIIWKLTYSRFSLWNSFWNWTLCYHRNSPLGSSPFGHCYVSYFMINFFNLDKTHCQKDQGLSESQGFIFCDRSDIHLLWQNAYN